MVIIMKKILSTILGTILCVSLFFSFFVLHSYAVMKYISNIRNINITWSQLDFDIVPKGDVSLSGKSIKNKIYDGKHKITMSTYDADGVLLHTLVLEDYTVSSSRINLPEPPWIGEVKINIESFQVVSTCYEFLTGSKINKSAGIPIAPEYSISLTESGFLSITSDNEDWLNSLLNDDIQIFPESDLRFFNDAVRRSDSTAVSPILSIPGKNAVKDSGQVFIPLLNVEGDNDAILSCDGTYSVMLNSNYYSYQPSVCNVGISFNNETHILSAISQVEPPCHTPGVAQHYKCDACNKYFEDPEHTKEITDLTDWKLKNGRISPENLERINARDATCSIAGHKEYYLCRLCDAYFEDENGSKPIADINEWSIPIDPYNHNNMAANYIKYDGFPATCTSTGQKPYYYCKSCHYYFADSSGKNRICSRDEGATKKEEWLRTDGLIPMLGHSHSKIITPASIKADGLVQDICSTCKAVFSNTVIPKAYIVSDDTAKYTGKAIKQAIKVVDAKGKAIPKSFYSVSYKNNTKIGKATATIKFKGNYSGSVNSYFSIVKKDLIPAKISGLKVTAASKALKVSWKKGSTNTDGYEIQYSTDKNFLTKVKTVKVSNIKTTSKDIKKLKAKTAYYVRIRAYNTEKKTTAHSPWTVIKKAVKTK